MDDRRVDDLARAVTGAAGSRRALAQAVAGSFLAIVFRPAPEAAARCVRLGKRCAGKRGEPDKKCCGGAGCQGTRCRCRGGKVGCGGRCVSRCAAGQVREPAGCGCCSVNDAPCDSAKPAACCSETCLMGRCAGRANGTPCNFDAQCLST